MFNKLLIANRGEIACRVIKTAKKMGIQTVAVYSTADQNSLHVQLADTAYCIGEPKAQQSYLNSDAIINAAKASGSEAIHPGYGFLSENAEFARACQKAGIVFIGSSITAMQAMASKQLAKQLLEKTNVPLTPGYHGRDQSDTTLLKEAQKIGFPVLLKAANGGGGKGMRAVHDKKDFQAELEGARRESEASFGDDTLIIEKFVINPRHIEVQIMADNHGNIVHLFERDCSLQRRHQKIIEEAPAPNLKGSVRKQLIEAACEVARSIDYRGAGTVEFLVSQDKHIYFMEMNTRLQVEHPVTEMITGLDLVAWQIKIAANEPLPCNQHEITQRGHAIECRIYAEDPQQNFMPSVGHLHFIKPPEGTGIRLDTGVAIGSDISMYYDPMIAKLIAWGETREEALHRLHDALSNYAIGGVKTNIPFLRAIIQTPRFQQGKITTDFLSQESITIPAIDPNSVLLFAAAFDYLKAGEENNDPLWQHAFAWQPHLTQCWVWHYQIAAEIGSVEITPINPKQLMIGCAAEQSTLSVSRRHEQLVIDNGHEKKEAVLVEHQGKIVCYFPEGVVSVARYTSDADAQSAGLNHELTAPMPATIVAILKNKGDAVKQGERLIVLEAMKMEHTIYAPKDGILSDIYYAVGVQVPEGVELVALSD